MPLVKRGGKLVEPKRFKRGVNAQKGLKSRAAVGITKDTRGFKR